MEIQSEKYGNILHISRVVQHMEHPSACVCGVCVGDSREPGVLVESV